MICGRPTLPKGSTHSGTCAPLFLKGFPDKLILHKMFSLFILVFSAFALLKFGVSQWRALWITAAQQPISDSLRVNTGIDGAAVGPGDFGTILGFCDRLSPDSKRPSTWLKEVAVYYRALTGLDKLLGVKIPAISAWAKREMQTCSRYAAAVLDQSLSMSIDRQFAVRGN